MSADRDRLALLVHEVRSPVAALAAIAQTYSDESLEPAARRSLTALALAACHGIERVVTDATVASVRRVDLDVVPLVVDAVGAAILGGARIRAEVEDDVPSVEADPLRVRQALDNLVANAIAHSPADREIVVSLRSGEGAVLLSVADEGEGVPLEEQERIFDAGVRLDAARPGSGLGLAVVRAIAEAHGGELTLQSTPGEGATFTVMLPARAP